MHLTRTSYTCIAWTHKSPIIIRDIFADKQLDDTVEINHNPRPRQPAVNNAFEAMVIIAISSIGDRLDEPVH